MRRISLTAILSILVLVTGISLAQTTSGDMVGTVQDPTGAVIPNAGITAVNVDTKVSYTATANTGGEWHISNLPSGDYDLTATSAGFSTYKLTGVRIDLNKTSTIPLVLTVSGNNQSVEVNAVAAVALDTTTTNLTQTLTNAELAMIPTATVGLGVLNTSLLSANVASSGGVGAGTGPSVGGQRPRNNNFTIEGIDNNDKGVTGPLVFIPNDAVSEFTLITNQFSPEFGHSSGGQFNTNVLSGTNHFHGRVYEYFQNRDLNAIDSTTAQSFSGTGIKPFNPRFDFNRYGGQVGGPILKDRLFFFANYERQTTGQTITGTRCTPTAAGFALLKANPNLNANNLAIFNQYVPVSPGSAGIDASVDAACFDQAKGPQFTPVFSGQLGTGTQTNIPLGNFQIAGATFTNFDALTTAVDYTISQKDSLRGRFLYNTSGSLDTAANLPAFWLTLPNTFYLFALSEYHTFSPNLVNEARIGYNRFASITSAGNFKYPGLDSFPNIEMDDLGIIIGPDGNAPQSTIQNLYQFTDNISWTKGRHQFKFGFDGRKYISPQTFTQRVRGDYEWFAFYNGEAYPTGVSDFLHDNAPTEFGQRSTGNFIYYGDQTALYGYVNDTFRVRPTVTLNFGVRYEFTTVPVGERQQALNSAASAPGVITFAKPTPQGTNFVPRIGINWAPDPNTSVRLGFGMANDVLYDNQGLLSLPPQFSSTNTVGDGNTYNGKPNPAVGAPNFLANGGLPAGTGTLQTFTSVALQRAATAAFVPNQVLPYAETYTVGVQHVFHSDYTAEIRYVGTRGIHLPAQIQINKQPKVDATHFLPTLYATPSQAVLDSLYAQNTLASISARSATVPSYAAAGFTGAITSYQPYASSNYNSLGLQLTKRMKNGLQMDVAYTWSKAMDDATADVFSTVLTPRRAEDSQNLNADYSRSALDRTNRFTFELLYDLQAFKTSHNFLLHNVVGNWLISPIYTYQSPEYGTVTSGIDANLNGDAAPDRFIVNPSGNKSLGAGATAVYNLAHSNVCAPVGGVAQTQCSGNLVAYVATNPNAYYVTANSGALANGGRNTLPLRPIDDIDVTASKGLQIHEAMRLDFQAQIFNALNHPQFISGSINQVNSIGDTGTATSNFLKPSSAAFNQPQLAFSSNSRTMQLALKFSF
jgi:Carboxypeptidase regulatory-like domain/TonB dependent receptor